MNVTNLLTWDYEKRTLGQRGENKANTKPIQTRFKPKQSQFQDPHYQSGCEKGPDRVYIIMFNRVN